MQVTSILKPAMVVALLATLFAVSGCATVSEAVPVGDGRYVVTLRNRSSFDGDDKLLQKGIDKANAFCDKKDMNTSVMTTNTNGDQIWAPNNNQIVFSCTPKS